MANLSTFGGNITDAPRSCECVICGSVQSHDVCDVCHVTNPDGSVDNETLTEWLTKELAELAELAAA